MNGLLKILERITPIIMLICCICLGITYTFQGAGQQNLTYLSKETILVDDRNTIQTQDDITIDNYTFDITAYRQNLDINILKRSVTNTIDIETYKSNIETFDRIWEDGYQFLDGVQTVINAVILVINSIITVINLFITPIRIIAGILLTGISLVGIRTDTNGIIIRTLNRILDYLAIPLMQPTYNQDDSIEINGTTWQMDAEPYIDYTEIGIDHYWNFQLNFTCQRSNYEFTGIRSYIDDNVEYIVYTYGTDSTLIAYNSTTGWSHNDYIFCDLITITNNNWENNSTTEQVILYLQMNARQIQA